YEFSKEQVFALISYKRIGQSKSQVTSKEGEDINIYLVSNISLEEKTIKQTAQHVIKDKLSKKDVKAISRTLVETSSDAIVALYYLFKLQRELWPLNTSEKIIFAILNSELKNLGKLGFTYLSIFLKKDEFISESGKPPIPSFLYKLEAVFASVVHGPKNVLKANTYTSEALRHSPNNHAFPSKRYTIVNM
ncbi:31106_t:CDS:2, partial [Gigaspora margarita]